MGEYADDAVDRDFNHTYGGHDWFKDDDGRYPHRIQRNKEHDPDCTGQLVTRVNSHTGDTFMGCTNFPKCKYTE